MLKRYTVKKEMVDKQRERYSRRIIGSGQNLAQMQDIHETDPLHDHENQDDGGLRQRQP